MKAGEIDEKCFRGLPRARDWEQNLSNHAIDTHVRNPFITGAIAPAFGRAMDGFVRGISGLAVRWI
jgi:hypothetical protein